MAGCNKARGLNKPKMKSNRAAKKRFSLTGTGLVKYKKKNLRHGMSNKNRKRKRNLRKAGIMSAGDAGLVMRSLAV
ncbi:MAG: 50S ribosomal protein L35 [Myxococcales bacterium]|nr:50S ribosomal protein L35 [Myxococcales bacterium]USN51235.1 MAG: 50S ribosomal protein L35 [Myxococcales bacterium]